MNHEALSAESDRRIQSEKDRLMHEHDFITKKLKGTNYFATCCITCNDRYCNCCGELIE
jgi:hypothetical protein